MTRRDYTLIATVIRDAEVPPEVRRNLALSFAVALRHANANFDTARFMAACGVPQ